MEKSLKNMTPHSSIEFSLQAPSLQNQFIYNFIHIYFLYTYIIIYNFIYLYYVFKMNKLKKVYAHQLSTHFDSYVIMNVFFRN